MGENRPFKLQVQISEDVYDLLVYLQKAMGKGTLGGIAHELLHNALDEAAFNAAEIIENKDKKNSRNPWQRKPTDYEALEKFVKKWAEMREGENK